MGEPLVEGRTGTDRNGRRVVVRNGRIVYADAPQAATGRAAPRLSSADADFIRDQRDAANKAAGAVRAVDRFMSINTQKDGGTGQLRSVPLIGGILNSFSAPHQEMEGLTEGMLPGMRQPGSGTFTDADAVSARKSLPSVATLGPANTSRADFIRNNARLYDEYIEFIENWAQRRGNLLGAQAAWNARLSTQRGANSRTRPTSQVPRAQAPRAPVRVRTPQEAQRLPRGTVYQTPDGATYTR